MVEKELAVAMSVKLGSGVEMYQIKQVEQASKIIEQKSAVVHLGRVHEVDCMDKTLINGYEV